MCNCTTSRTRKIPGDPEKTSTRHHVFHTSGMVLILPSSRIHQPIHPSTKRQQAAIGIHQTANAHAQRRLGLTTPSSEPLRMEATDVFRKQQKRRVSKNRKATSFTALFLHILTFCKFGFSNTVVPTSSTGKFELEPFSILKIRNSSFHKVDLDRVSRPSGPFSPREVKFGEPPPLGKLT